MHFQYLIEDISGAILIDELMKKFVVTNPNVTYDCKGFHGLGGFTKKNTVKETKTGKLLNDLATYLKGFDRSFRHYRDYPVTIVVVLDNDDHDPQELKTELENVALQNAIQTDHIFCIAIEEIEAWLLGDEQAILAAYPNAKSNVLRSYVQDSICGTWEILADAIYPGGIQKIRSKRLSYMEIGKLKSEWAKNVGIHMDLHSNKSPSFNYFIGELDKRLRS